MTTPGDHGPAGPDKAVAAVNQAAAAVARPAGLGAWLMSPTPASRRQANLGRLFLAWRQLIASPLGLLGLVIVAALVVLAVFAPLLAPHDPTAQNLTMRLAAPSFDHWFGTDQLGRDIYSRILYGARVTLVIVVLVAMIAAPLGLVIGAVAGYLGGWVDVVVMRITDIFLAFPRLILALALVAALGPGIENAVIAIAITAWPVYARIARAETLTIRASEYVEAARQQGASWPRIVAKQIVPMCVNSMLVRVTLDMAGIILTAAGLGFLGLGAQPPAAEWGAMIAAGRGYLFDQWWVAAVPGIAILVVSLGFNLLGDALRDVLDPRS